VDVHRPQHGVVEANEPVAVKCKETVPKLQIQTKTSGIGARRDLTSTYKMCFFGVIRLPS
jgi:hypothetical protein